MRCAVLIPLVAHCCTSHLMPIVFALLATLTPIRVEGQYCPVCAQLACVCLVRCGYVHSEPAWLLCSALVQLFCCDMLQLTCLWHTVFYTGVMQYDPPARLTHFLTDTCTPGQLFLLSSCWHMQDGKACVSSSCALLWTHVMLTWVVG